MVVGIDKGNSAAYRSITSKKQIKGCTMITNKQLAVVKYVAENPGQSSKQVIQGLSEQGLWAEFKYTTGRLYLIIRCKRGGWIDTPSWRDYFSSHYGGSLKHAWVVTEAGEQVIS